MKKDSTNGYESIARDFIAYRSNSTIGAEAVRSWASTLGPKAEILNPGGQFLFTSPEAVCTWTDKMAGVESRSLGAEKYKRILSSAELSLIGNNTDEGDNYYYYAKKAKPA